MRCDGCASHSFVDGRGSASRAEADDARGVEHVGTSMRDGRSRARERCDRAEDANAERARRETGVDVRRGRRRRGGGDDDDDDDEDGVGDDACVSGRDASRAGRYARDVREDARRDEEARVVGKVVSVVLSEEEKKSSPRYRWAVGDKELREAMTNGENTVKSTMFTAKKHEFRLSLGNSVVVEGGPAKTFISAKLECCAPSSSSKLSRVSNFVDIAATMRVSLEFSGDVEISNDDNKRSIVLREAHTRQVLKTDQSECLVLRNFFKCDTAENNTTKHSARNKTTTETKNIFQLVCEVEFNSVEAVKRTNDNEEDINTFNDTAVVAYCVSLSPLLFVFENFLQKKECKFLRELAEKDLKRSRVTDGKLSNGRTSSSCFLTGAKGKEEVVKTIERRMLNAIRKTPVLTKRRFDTQNLKGSEPVQIVRYS